MKGDAPPDQLIAFARFLHKAVPIKDRYLLAAVPDQACTLKLTDGIGDGWPLHPQHMGKEGLSDSQRIAIAPIVHHEQPTR
jgi:hypothetical protein